MVAAVILRIFARTEPIAKAERQVRPLLDRSARTIIAGHAFVQSLRRGHYELAVGAPINRQVALAFGELVLAI